MNRGAAAGNILLVLPGPINEAHCEARSVKLVLVVLLAALSCTSVFGSRVVVSISALHLGATPAEVGGIMSLYFLPPIVLSMFMGRLVDRAGVALPMALVAGLLVIGHVLPAAWPSLWMLAISAACTGTAFVGAMIALSSAAAFCGGAEDRAINFSWFTMGTGFGVGLGPFLSGFAIDGLGDRLASLTLGIWPVALLLVLALAGRRLPAVAAAVAGGKPASDVAPAGRMAWLDLLRDARLRAALTVGVMGPAGYEVFLFVLPVQGTRIGLSASTIGSLLAANAVAIFTIRLAMPVVVRWIREWTIMMVLFLALSASLLLLAVATQTWILYVISIVTGIAHGLGQPVMMSMYFSASPDGMKGEAAGLRGILQNTFSAASPLLMGGLGSILGLGPVLVATSVVFAWGGWFAHRQSARW